MAMAEARPIRRTIAITPLGMYRHARLIKLPLIPAFILALLLFTGIFAPWISPHDPRLGDLTESLTPPFWQEGGGTSHLMGTDFQGRDILSRVIHGSRISLIVLFFATLGAGVVGTFIGLVSGLAGGKVDALLMRIVDIVLALPGILIALVFAAAFGASILNIIIIVIISSWVRYARQVRGEVLSQKEREFVVSARAIGASSSRIMFVHLLPNVAATILVIATFSAGSVILLESSLSFLGIGIPPPTPAWGTMVADGRQWITIAWWVSMMPGLAIGATILAMNLLGDWLRDFLDPRLRGQG